MFGFFIHVSQFYINFEVLEEWENIAAISKAFAIGRMEAQAVSNLHGRISPALVALLRSAVAKRGMRSFITNELIAKGSFNHGWTSAQGSTEAWVGMLTNSDDDGLAT